MDRKLLRELYVDLEIIEMSMVIDTVGAAEVAAYRVKKAKATVERELNKTYEHLAKDNQMPRITGKIHKVSDRMCQACPQLFGNECRAYQMPHTEEERLQREANPFALCELRDPIRRSGELVFDYEVTYRKVPHASGKTYTAILSASSAEGAMQAIQRMSPSKTLFSLSAEKVGD